MSQRFGDSEQLPDGPAPLCLSQEVDDVVRWWKHWVQGRALARKQRLLLNRLRLENQTLHELLSYYRDVVQCDQVSRQLSAAVDLADLRALKRRPK